MSLRRRLLRSRAWRSAVGPEIELASAEGLAAGTGLLTGDVARAVTGPSRTPCPSCGDPAEVLVMDLVQERSSLRCPACGLRWSVEGVQH